MRIGGITEMGNEILKEIGKRLLSARKAKDYTQEQVANLTGLSIKMVSAAENGHKAMRPENIIKICECLSIVWRIRQAKCVDRL